MVNDKISLSAAVSGERAKYAEYRIEQKDANKSDFIRAAIDALREQDTEFESDADEETLQDSRTEDPEIIVKGINREYNLADAESDIFNPEKKAKVPVYNLDGWKESEAIAKQYDDTLDGRFGRKHIFLAALRCKDSPSRQHCIRTIRTLGIAERTAERSLDRLILEGLFATEWSQRHPE